MKKIIFAVVAVLTISASVYVYTQKNNATALSELAMANIEALAYGENSGGVCNGCNTISWGWDQILKCDCSYTGIFSSCDQWGC